VPTDPTVTVSGRIYRDPETGLYVSVIDAWDISACGKTIDEAVAQTWRMIDGYLATARDLGVLEAELAKVGAPPLASASADLHLKARLSVDAVVEEERDIDVRRAS